MKVETTIPFSGFYHSVHCDIFDHEISELFSNDHGDPYDCLVSRAFEDANWKGIHKAYAKEYSELFAEAFEFKTLSFQDLVSPQYYNFTTDRIFCTIDQEEVKEIYSKVSKEDLEEKIREKFTSRSGFISHYTNSLGSWGLDICSWDHNQVGTLIEVYVEGLNNGSFSQRDEGDLVFSSYTPVYEILEPIFSNHIENIERLYKIYDYLRYRDDRQWRNKSV